MWRRWSVAGRRSSWPGGTAGPTSRPPASPTWHSQPCWPGRGGPGGPAPAALRLARAAPHAAAAALAPVLDGSAPITLAIWLAQAFLLEAIARDALGDPAAAGRAIERALDLAEPDGTLGSFLLHPAPGLLERHARHRTAHASLLTEVRSLLAGRTPAPAAAGPQPLLEPLRDSQLPRLR